MVFKTQGTLFKKIGPSTLVLVAIVISSIIYFLSLKDKEKTARLKLQENLNNITKEKIMIEDELRKTSAEKTMLEETIAKLKVKMDELGKGLDKEKDVSRELSDKLKEKEKETEKLKLELSSLRKEKETLESKIIEAEGKIKTLADSLNQLQLVKSELERKLDNIMSKRLEVELERVVVKPRTPGMAKILAVNNSYDFVVVNLGQQHGMDTGKIMGVYQGNDLVANIKITKVYEMMSVADIIFEASEGIIREEDSVKELSSDVVPSLSSPN